MPITLEVTYCKKLGLPKYSSHSHALTVRVELESVSEVEKTSAKLHKTLQRVVDSHLKQVGFLPTEDYGQSSAKKPARGKVVPVIPLESLADLAKGKANMVAALTPTSGWRCLDFQRAMILNLVDEYDLKKPEVERMAKSLHGVGVRALDQHQADDLIRELQRLDERKTADC